MHIDDRLQVRPGDSVPVDGVVLEGRSAVDESMVTGESMPVEKEQDAKLIGGTINGTGALMMRAEKVGSDTMLARIVHMVSEAQRSRAPIQRLADVVSSWFVPAVILVAVVAFIAWMIWDRRRPLPTRWSLQCRSLSLPAPAGTSLITRVTTCADRAAPASRPPLMPERCSFTVLISMMFAPLFRSASLIGSPLRSDPVAAQT